MYVAVKGGERAIHCAHRLLAKKRRGDTTVSSLNVTQISQQLNLAVDRVMNEASLYDRELAALAIKQSSGDLVEAIFLLRAYRTTLARFMIANPIETNEMEVNRRISAIYKDIPGGQLLGPTYDYTHRLLDFALLAESDDEQMQPYEDSRLDEALKAAAERLSERTLAQNETEMGAHLPKVSTLLAKEQLIKGEIDDKQIPPDVTREPVMYPCNRASRLQQLVRGDEGFLLALGYSTQRGYGRNHPFAGEIRTGQVEITIEPEELGFPIVIGEITVTECEMITGFKAEEDELPHFTQGYGLVFGAAERKAMSMAVVDRALQSAEYQEPVLGPAQDEEFVLAHADNVDAAGFLSHLKLPHYVDFQAELSLVRQLQKEYFEAKQK
ncbi:carbon-phosphorus lyase complex subunit PhnI [Thorsellia anophelis]|uniref:Methylphosphonate degradation complex, subunit phnI n=1 Tax=Thorsellia anophelis DSM 18579 TaxID=1123402 RepID=A0A1I0ARE0_9GAMM|nr:carbon-phosphorus lyase complex subunit PhnI [Thorsellia anophelis]SES96972.1 methylphosphonate degradation complex, subunit phnI [Thorsellia anophelis DSM 18579]